MKGHQQLNNETVEVEQVALGNGNTMGVSQEGGFSCNKVTDNLNSVEVDASTTMAVVKAKKPVGGLSPKVASATPVSHIQNEFSPENSQSCEKHHAARKYQRKSRKQSSRKQLLAKTDREYSELVDAIQRLRMANKNPASQVKALEKLKTQRKKLQKMAQAQSSIPEVGCQLLTGLRTLIDYMKAARDVIGENTLKFLLDLYTTLYNIYKTPEWDTVLVNMTSFFSRHFPIKYADYALVWLKSAFEVAFAQSSGLDFYKETILKLFTNSSDLLDDMLWENISELFVKLATLYACVSDAVSLEAVDMETIVKQFRNFKTHLPVMKDVIETAFSCYEFVLGNWKAIRTGDWSVILLGKNETQEFELEVRVLEQAFPFIIANKEVELKDKFNLTKDGYDKRLKAAIQKAKTLISRCTSTQQKMSVSNFVKSLTDKQAQIYASVADAPRKMQAYALKLSGPSGTGKSTLLNMNSKVLLNAYNHDPSERGQVVFTNISERYESTILPNHKIICADDVANNKNEKPNYDRILNYVNTVPRPLEKADVKEKGIYYPGNDVLMVTTNDATLRVLDCSSCPESILRRFTLDVVVEARPQFRNAYGGLMKFKEPRYDVYKLTLRRFSHIAFDKDGENPEIIWDTIPREIWNPFDDEDHDFAAMCSFISKDVKDHIKQQTQQEEAQRKLDECTFCRKCGCPDVLCYCVFPAQCKCCQEDECVCEKYDTKNGNHDWCRQCFMKQELNEFLDTREEEEAVAMFGSPWSTFSTSELWDYRAAIGGCTQSMRKLYTTGALWTRAWRYRSELRKLVLAMFGTVFIAAFIDKRLAWASLSLSAGRLYYLYRTMVREVDDELNSRVDRLSCLCEDIKEHLRSNMVKYFAAGSSIVFLYKAYQMLKPLLGAQDKTTYFDEASDLFNRLLQNPRGELHRFHFQDEKNYKEGYSRVPPKDSGISKTTSSESLQRALARALRFVVIKSKGQIYGTVNGIMVDSNILLVPSHIIPGNFPFDVETSTTPGVPSAMTKDQKLTEEFVFIDRTRDYALIHLASSPASTDFLQFFPDELPTFTTRATTLLWKSPENKVLTSKQPARQLTEDLTYRGYLEKDGLLYGTKQVIETYTLQKGKGLKVSLDFQGFGGLCGGMYVDSSKGLIYGFHVAGYAASHTGYMTCLTKSDIQKGIDKIKSTSPTLVVHSAQEVVVNKYGKPYTIEEGVPLYQREDGNQEKSRVTYFGKLHKDGAPERSFNRTPYMKTPFKGVPENLGKNQHRPPVNPNDIEKSMKTLNKLTRPVQHYEGAILVKAVNDFKSLMLNTVRKNLDKSRQMLRRYSLQEALDGTGDFGMGPIPSQTSTGHPLHNSKLKHLKRDPNDPNAPQVPRVLESEHDIEGEVERVNASWLTGKRAEAMWKAHSKVNELLEWMKAFEKVRKFYGSEFAILLAGRQALGGLAKFMNEFWEETECLVGINPMSADWKEFHDHLTGYSNTNMIAGDFSGFDTTMAAQITGAASQIIVEMYTEAGASEDELQMVRGALSDIIHPNVIFEGDVYRFANGNPSGNLITVQLNSMCNSIMMRYVYYAMNPSVKEPFASNVRLCTYGDDNAMSVKHHCRWFNHTSCQEEFARLDIGYTMADKGAESVPYIPISEISFLKRHFVQHETLGTIVAPVEEASILKKFHYVKKPGECPLSAAEQFGAYTDGAFREAYLHGRDYYLDFQSKILNIVSLNPELEEQVAVIPYEEMTEVLRGDYERKAFHDPKNLFAESLGVDREELIGGMSQFGEEL